jgi:ferric-dicitrate binding protein FerR (iron transport regulator)
MSQTVLRRYWLVGLPLAILLLAGVVSVAQEASREDGFLLGTYLKTRTLIDKATADLQKIGREIQENGRDINKAEEIIKLAKQRDNKPAESAAREALSNGREARKKNKEIWTRIELVMTRTEAYLATVKDLMASQQGQGSNSRIRGIVSRYSGRVEILKKNGEKAPLDGTSPGLLEPGDEIAAATASGAEIQTLDGRGTVQMGGNSRLKLEEDTPDMQALRLVEGKIYSEVDKAEDFAAMLQDKMGQYRNELLALPGTAWDKSEAWFRRLAKKFEVRTIPHAMAVRGTRFSVEIRDGDTTDLLVFEGSVEMSDHKGEQTVLVEQGFKVVATKDGISEPQKIADIDKWWEK